MNAYFDVSMVVIASAISGIATAVYSDRKNSRQKAQDALKMELKDLQIKLYQLEIDLTEWKDKYYEAIQELISVKSELEKTLITLEHFKMHES